MTTQVPLPTDHLHYFNHHTGRPRFHFDENPPPPAPPPAPPAPPPTAWHTGVDTDTLGFWQNKGLPLDDPKALASKLTEQYRAAERHIGAPPDRIIRLPEKPDDVAGWNAVHSKLGVPTDAKDYDFSAVKRADGSDVSPALADALRAGLLNARVPKDRAADFVKGVVKGLDDIAAQDVTVATGKLAAEKAELAKDWGANFDFNHLKAMEGARRAGITPEGVKALEGQIGYKAVMEHFRKIGSNMSEDAFHDGNAGGAGPTTAAGAQARLNDLMADPAWGKRLTAGDATAKAEWTALTTQIASAA